MSSVMAQSSDNPEQEVPVMDERPQGYRPLEMPVGQLVLESYQPAADYGGLDQLVYTPLPIEEAEEAPAKSTITVQIHQKMVAGRANFMAEDHSHMSPATGYWCRLGEVGLSSFDTITSADGTKYIPVNILHLDFGLRLPLHAFLSLVLCKYTVCINQITPASMRRVLGFIWTCEFFNFPLTLDLFRACFRLAKGGGTKGYMSFVNANQRVTLYPSNDSSKDYQARNVYVRVPLKPGHPHKFLPPLQFSEPTRLPYLKESDLKTGWEKLAFRYFDHSHIDARRPKYWLPHADLLRVEKYLALGGLSPRWSVGKLCGG